MQHGIISGPKYRKYTRGGGKKDTRKKIVVLIRGVHQDWIVFLPHCSRMRGSTRSSGYVLYSYAFTLPLINVHFAQVFWFPHNTLPLMPGSREPIPNCPEV